MSPNRDELLEAEYAVFSGKLMRHILGSQQPDYYLARNESGTKFYRISNKLEHYKDWGDVVKKEAEAISFQWDDEEEQDISDVDIVGLVELFVVCHFLGEADWEEGNFGFIKDDSIFRAVRLDPGFSFRPFLIDNNDIDLKTYIDNFVINYLTNEISKESDVRYLTDFIDYDKQCFVSLSAKKLFSNKDRIISVIENIANIGEEDLAQIKIESFTHEHYSKADNLIRNILTRINLYKNYIEQLKESEEEESASEAKGSNEVEDTAAENEKYDESRNPGQKRKRVPLGFFAQNIPQNHDSTDKISPSKEEDKNKRARTEIISTGSSC